MVDVISEALTISRDPASISTPPTFPIPPWISLAIAPPSNLMASAVRTVTLPALPCPSLRVLSSENSSAFPVSDSVCDVTFTSPPFPVAVPRTALETKLPSNSATVPVALILISPAWASGAPMPSSIPPRSLLKSDIWKFRAWMAISPPPPARTFTSASLLRDTSARSTPSGKLKLLSAFTPTVPTLANPPNSTRPPRGCTLPPSRVTLPPTNARVAPDGTDNPRTSPASFVATD